MPTLVFEIEDGSQVVAPLEGRTTIGSAEGNDIVAEREDIAPHHAEIFRGGDGTWWVRDRNSAAGTFVNGTRVTTTPHLARGPSPYRLDFGPLLRGHERRRDRIGPRNGGWLRPRPTRTSRRKGWSFLELVDALTLARAQFERTVKEREERLGALHEQAAKLESAVGSRKQELSVLGSALANAQARMEKDAKIHESRVAQLQEHASGLESDIGRKKQKLTVLDGALRDAEKTINESKSLVTGLHGSRKKHVESAKTGIETAGRNEPMAHRVETFSEQTRSKPVEMERLEHDLVDLEARKAVAASALEEHESARQRAEEALKLTTLEREEADTELTKLAGEKSRLADDVRWLGVKCGGLALEISVLETRKTELRKILDGLVNGNAEAVKKLAAARRNSKPR